MRHPPNAAITALELRCQLAVARVIDSFDRGAAEDIAKALLRVLIQSIQRGADPAKANAWPIHSDPVLRVVHQAAQALYKRRRAAFKKLDLHRGLKAQRSAQRRRTIEQRMSEEPSAEALLAQLQAGMDIAVDRHTLTYTKKIKGLVGVNPHGHDYYAGAMTLESVKYWRNSILSGLTMGETPGGFAEPAPQQQDLERELLREIDHIDIEFHTLARLEGIDFAGGLEGVSLSAPGLLTPRNFMKSLL